MRRRANVAADAYEWFLGLEFISDSEILDPIITANIYIISANIFL